MIAKLSKNYMNNIFDCLLSSFCTHHFHHITAKDVLLLPYPIPT